MIKKYKYYLLSGIIFLGLYNYEMLLDIYRRYESKFLLNISIDELLKEKATIHNKIYIKSDILDKKTENIENQAINKLFISDQKIVGDGLEIILEDGNINDLEEKTDVLYSQKTIHDIDINMLLNDLRKNGAEFIEINGIRLSYDTYIYCAGPFLLMADKKVPAPFIIEVIGDSNILIKSLMEDSNIIKSFINRGIKVSINHKKDMVFNTFS